MMKISILVLVVLFEFVCSRSVPGPTGNATHAYTEFSTEGPAVNISQKCKMLFEECTETKECCGVDVQCAQWGDDSQLCQGAPPLCKNNYEACDPDMPNDCCSGRCTRYCKPDAPFCTEKNDTFCKVDNFRRDCPSKCGTCGHRCVSGKWPFMGPIKF